MDIESTMQFIINQQAQFVADIHQLRESQRELQENQKNLQENQKELQEIQKDVQGSQKDLQESQKDLGMKVDKLHANVFKLHEVVKQHNDAHVVTNATVSKLADHLEDFAERQGWLFDGHKQLFEA